MFVLMSKVRWVSFVVKLVASKIEFMHFVFEQPNFYLYNLCVNGGLKSTCITKNGQVTCTQKTCSVISVLCRRMQISSVAVFASCLQRSFLCVHNMCFLWYIYLMSYRIFIHTEHLVTGINGCGYLKGISVSEPITVTVSTTF